MPGPDRELLLKEADWVHSEIEDFVRLIQRYRSLYVTALTASIGWLLGHALEPDYVQRVMTLQSRPEISAALCLIPMLSCFFVALIFEAQFHMRSLARYRYLLGVELGCGKPAWGWEDWKKTSAGSVRSWNIPSNIFFGVAALAVPIGALVLAWPAAADKRSWLIWLWTGSASTFVLFVVIAIWVGVENFYVNRDYPLAKRRLPEILAQARTTRVQ
jgi:hypothetical protein